MILPMIMRAMMIIANTTKATVNPILELEPPPLPAVTVNNTFVELVVIRAVIGALVAAVVRVVELIIPVVLTTISVVVIVVVVAFVLVVAVVVIL